MTELSIGTYEIPAADLGPENPLPVFRGEDDDIEVRLGENVPEEDRKHIGWDIAERILPYRMLDGYTRKRRLKTFAAVILENEWLKAIITPELGGRLMSLIHKPDNRELLERNPVFQPANVALRNAWISGGVEWNTSQLGHYYLTVSPVFAARIVGMHGEPALRLYEWDRLKCFPWQIDFHLPPNSRFLFVHPRLVNPHEHELSMYWWSNIAVPEDPDMRTLAPAETALSHQPGSGELTVLPMPCPTGYDMSYPTNAPSAGEAFFRIPKEQRKWIAQVDRAGKGLMHVSTDRLRGRKMFFWGMNQGGRRWQETLSVDGRAYIELQGGLATTQLECVPMPARARWSWTEAYGMLETDPETAHGDDWTAAWRAADDWLEKTLPRSEMEKVDSGFDEASSRAPEEVFSRGSGWGALERARAAAAGETDPIPGELVFEADTIGEDEAPWLALLEAGSLPERNTADDPGQFMIQDEWRVMLETALGAQRGAHWLSWLHLGVMRMEARDTKGAREAWERSVECKPTGWAFANLAVLEEREGRLDPASQLLGKAWETGPQVRPLAQEYLRVMIKQEKYAEAMSFLDNLPRETMAHDRIRLALAKCALEARDFDRIEEIFTYEFAQIRECETTLTDLWFAFHEHRVCEAEGVELTDEVRERVKREFPPPKNIDFRMDVTQ